MPPHCDSLDGPVVEAARRALEIEDAGVILPYVAKEGEGEVRKAFELAVKARTQGPEAKEVADLYFFETAVRVHRRGEGAPYEGLKPAGLDVGPVIPLAETAIKQDDPKPLGMFLIDALQGEMAGRFDELLRAKARAHEGVDEAREYVEASLGLQVWSHKLYGAMKARPHEGEHHHG